MHSACNTYKYGVHVGQRPGTKHSTPGPRAGVNANTYRTVAQKRRSASSAAAVQWPYSKASHSSAISSPFGSPFCPRPHQILVKYLGRERAEKPWQQLSDICICMQNATLYFVCTLHACTTTVLSFHLSRYKARCLTPRYLPKNYRGASTVVASSV